MRVSTSQFQQEGVFSILEQQAKLSKVQQQLATGRRILSPSVDPAASARALDLNKTIGTIEQYNSNAERAEHRLKLEDAVLEEVSGSLQRLRELTVQANNATQDAVTRKHIGAEMSEIRDHLVELANSSDGNGEYLFAGTDSKTRPFTQSGSGVSYQGNQDERLIQVGPSRQVASSHSGFEVFMSIPNGNGSYLSAPEDGNSGSGVIGEVSVTDAAAVDPAADEYRVSFGIDADGGKVYYIEKDGALVEPDPAAVAAPGGLAEILAAAPGYQSGNAIQVDGLSVEIDGQPDDGDTFTIAPSRGDSLFNIVDRVVDANLSGLSSTEFHNAANRGLAEIDQALEKVLGIRAEGGARQKALEQEQDANETALLELKTTLSKTQDLDYAKAVSDFNLKLVGLQAAQQSFVKIQGLSLFNYL